MSEAQALLKAICDHPGEDTPRLAYADWLDENGDPATDGPRAEFIRVQCELARMEGDDPRRPELARREAELSEHAAGWRAELPEGVFERLFHRGFLQRIICGTATAFGAAVRELFPREPIEAVWIPGDEPVLRAASRNPALARIHDLGVDGPHPDGLRSLLASQFVTDLRGLHLQRLRVPSNRDRLADYVPTLDAPHLVSVTRLSLSFSALTVDELRRFIRRGILCRLIELTLSCDAMTDLTARETAATSDAADLRTLRLCGGRRGDESLCHLANSPHLAGLERLAMFNVDGLTDDGLRVLASSPHLRNLTDLDLRYTDVTADGVQAIIDSPNLPRLSRLILAGTPAATPDARTDSSLWYAFPPDQHPGVVWVSEMRQRPV